MPWIFFQRTPLAVVRRLRSPGTFSFWCVRLDVEELPRPSLYLSLTSRIQDKIRGEHYGMGSALRSNNLLLTGLLNLID